MKVYYSDSNNCFNYGPPENLLSALKKERSKLAMDYDYFKDAILLCPSVLDELKNTFVIRSQVFLSLSWETQSSWVSSDLSQKEFDRIALVRSGKSGCVSLRVPSPIFYAEKPVMLRIQPAIYHANDYARKTTIISGTYDIGRHLRPLDAAFFFSKPDSNIRISAGDALFYIKLLTDEPIEFVPFWKTPGIQEIITATLANRDPRSPLKNLKYWYSYHKNFYRKRALKEINSNLI